MENPRDRSLRGSSTWRVVEAGTPPHAASQGVHVKTGFVRWRCDLAVGSASVHALDDGHHRTARLVEAVVHDLPAGRVQRCLESTEVGDLDRDHVRMDVFGGLPGGAPLDLGDGLPASDRGVPRPFQPRCHRVRCATPPPAARVPMPRTHCGSSSHHLAVHCPDRTGNSPFERCGLQCGYRSRWCSEHRAEPP